MNGKERVLNAFKLQKTDRIPWIPFVGCHGGSLLNVSAHEYLKSEELIFKGVSKAIEKYKPDGIPVMFDLQLEAEILGCRLKWAEDNPPAVASHPLKNRNGLTDISIPLKNAGRLKTVLNATRKLREANPDLALYGLITGPFTLALHLYGTNIFLKMFEDPVFIKELMKFCRDVCIAIAGYHIEAGCDIIAVVDPMTSQISTNHFIEFVTPYIEPVFINIKEQGAMSSFFVCGHAQHNIESMCNCGPDNISIDENIPLDFVKDICLTKGISFGGNLQLTTILLLGSVEDAQRNAVECMTIGGEKGFLLAPGCDLPYAVPPDNLEGIYAVVADPYQREIIKNKSKEDVSEDLLDMHDYGQIDKVIVDIITLDSEGCAPCQYMVESVRAVAPEFEGIVEWREHKIKYKEALVFMTSLMVKNIPTICIDGKITFVSRIPPRDELVAALQKRIYEKFRMKIKRRRASLYVLGDGGEECSEVLQNAEKAVRELGVDVSIQMITDESTMLSYGVAPIQTPAVVMAKYQLKSIRRTPEVNIIKEWIKTVE